MIQQVIVLLIFIAALGYAGTRMWKTLRRPEAGGCGKGCVHAAPKPPTSPAR